jgi:hypothetical protein
MCVCAVCVCVFVRVRLCGSVCLFVCVLKAVPAGALTFLVELCVCMCASQLSRSLSLTPSMDTWGLCVFVLCVYSTATIAPQKQALLLDLPRPQTCVSVVARTGGACQQPALVSERYARHEMGSREDAGIVRQSVYTLRVALLATIDTVCGAFSRTFRTCASSDNAAELMIHTRVVLQGREGASQQSFRSSLARLDACTTAHEEHAVGRADAGERGPEQRHVRRTRQQVC